MLVKKLLFFLIHTLIASTTFASTAYLGKTEIDGNVLLNKCDEAIKYIENRNAPHIDISAVNFCVGFISGVNEMHTAFVKSVTCFDPPVYCAPISVSSEQLVKNVVNFLRAHPEDLHFHGSFLTLSALKKAYPCDYNTTPK